MATLSRPWRDWRLKLSFGSGRSLLRILLLLTPFFLVPLPQALGQEAPSPTPSAPTQEGPAGPPVSPTPGPIGPEDLGPGGPVRTFRFAPVLEERGPLRVQAFLTVEEEFTDNVNQQKDNRKSEFRTSIAPVLASSFDRPLATLSMVYAPRYFLPGNRPEDAALDHNLTLRSGWSPTAQLRLSVAEDLTKSTDFRDLEDPASRQTGTAGFLRNQATIETAYTPPQGRLALGYTNNLVQNDAPGADNSLTHALRADGELTGPRLTLGGTYTLTRGEFDIAPPYWEHTGEARLRRPFSPTASGTLSASFTHHDEEGGQDFIGGRVRIGGTFALGPDGSLDASGGAEVFAPRDASQTVRPSVSIAWTQRFSLFSLSLLYTDGFQLRFQTVDNTGVTASRSVALLLTSLAFRDLTATLGARWTENRFEQTTAAGGSAGTKDRTWDVDALLRYYILRPLSLTLGYTFTIRTSTTPTAEFVENRVRIGLTYQHNIL